MGANRNQRRASAARAGVPWRQAQMDRLMREGAERAESLAVRMSPQEAREALARWAAILGRTQEEVDALNAKAGSSLEVSNADRRQ